MAAMGHHTQACFYNPENLRNLKKCICFNPRLSILLL